MVFNLLRLVVEDECTLFICSGIVLCFMWWFFIRGINAIFKFKKFIVYSEERIKQDTFIFQDRACRTSKSEELLNLDNFFAFADINKSALFSVGNVLVGLGVLGTFFGLSLGLGNSDINTAQTTDDVMQSIGTLFDGSKTAFVTSLVGMFFSLVYGGVLRWIVNEWQKQIKEKCNELDRIYYISDVNLQIATLQSIDNRMFQLGEIGAQFSTQLTASISKTMTTNVTEILNVFNDAIAKTMVGISDRLIESTESINQASSNLTSIIQKISSLLSPETTARIDQVSVIVNSMCNRMTEVCDRFNGVCDNINTAIPELGDSIVQLQEASVAMRNNIGEVKSDMVDVINEFDNSLKSFKAIQGKNEELFDKFGNQINNYSQLIGNEKDLIVRGKEVVDRMDEIVEEFTQLDVAIERIFGQINKGINEYITNMNARTTSLVKEYADSFTDACTSINHTTSAFSNTIDEFRTVQGKAVELINAINKTIESMQDKHKE